MSEISTPWGPTGYLVYKRTYARELLGRTEEFKETIYKRIIPAAQEQLGVGFTLDEATRLGKYLEELKGSVAGRFWWQLGTKTVKDFGLLSLQNCAVVPINEPIRPFTWAMDALMLGCGVGFNIQREYVYELPRAKNATIIRKDTNDADFIIPDSREGWVELLRRTLEAHFITGKGFSYSAVCVRGAGLPIKGFGGVSSGPEPLCGGINKISDILNSRAGKKVRSIDCLDIMNLLGEIIVSGNVRRSAQIAIGDMDDELFLNAKRWDLGNIPNHRAMSNNSVVCNDMSKLPEAFWEGYKGNGEPYGLINLNLARTVGRLGDTRYQDLNIIGFNPCAEQSLEAYETCCLSEIFLPNISSLEELKDLSKLLYRINKHSLMLPCHLKETEEVVHKNMRMGIGVTGYLQATEEQRSWLNGTYDTLRQFDRDYSAAHGMPTSIKLTTVKPSGTLSLLAGVTPGCHPGYSMFYIRRIRIASNSPLVQTCRDHGYDVEYQQKFDGTLDYQTCVVSFPCRHPEGTVVAKDMTAIKQLEVVRRLQREWSDNSVSCTIYYRKEELPEIKEYLAANYNENFKTLSFLLHNEHGFIQAPLEEITEEKYNEMKARVKLITNLTDESISFDVDECLNGACPIR
jgi:ribonucleoside-triphosphate reductase (thioredoxin)